jgi:hypothetical protein
MTAPGVQRDKRAILKQAPWPVTVVRPARRAGRVEAQGGLA